MTLPMSFARDWFVRFVELQGFDRAVALAGQAFTALVPLLIVYSAVVSSSTGRDFADQVNHAFKLTGEPAASIRAAVATPNTVRSALSVIGILILVVSALSFTRALQRLYQLAWNQPPLGLKAAAWGLIWLAMVIVLVTLRPVLLGATGGVPRVALTIALSDVLWLLTPYVLLARRVAWRRLLPAALLTGVGMTALGVGSAIGMPRTVTTSAEQFGAIGIAFSLLSWLVIFGIVLVAATAAGAVIDRRLHPPAGALGPAARG
jgi:membrane protein